MTDAPFPETITSSPSQNAKDIPASTSKSGCRLTVMVSLNVVVHPASGTVSTLSKTKPLAISFTEGVKLGVSELTFVRTHGVPEAPVIFVQRIDVALLTSIKSGIVNVAPHIVIVLVVAESVVS